MSNGNIFREIKKVLESAPESIAPETRDRLVLEGIIGLHERIDDLPKIGLDEIKKLERHERALFGDENIKEQGLIKDVSDAKKDIVDIKEFIATMKADLRRAIWNIVTPILGVMGLGIVVLIVIGYTLGK